MNESNPYASPASDAGLHVPPQKLQNVAHEFTRLRNKRPTLAGMLFKKSGPAFIFAVAFFVIALILFLLPPSFFRAQLTVGFCGFCIGAIARDLAYLRTFVKWWPANAFFIDWNKVEQYSNH